VEKGHSQKLIRRKGISYASHRFHSQCITSFFSIQAILSLHFPTGEKKDEERKMKKEKKKKSEGKEVTPKKARAVLAAAHLPQPSHRH